MPRLTFSPTALLYWRTIHDTLVICYSQDVAGPSHLCSPLDALNLSHFNVLSAPVCQSCAGQLSRPRAGVIQPVLIYTNLDPIFGPWNLDLSLYLSVGSSQQISTQFIPQSFTMPYYLGKDSCL